MAEQRPDCSEDEVRTLGIACLVGFKLFDCRTTIQSHVGQTRGWSSEMFRVYRKG